MKTLSTEVVVLGAGPAGYVCAIRLAQLGKKVVVIDKDGVGGVCLNRGCIPSKALIYAGGLYDKMAHADTHLNKLGIEVSGVKLELSKLMSWKDGVVKKLTGGVATLLKANGCQVIEGNAQFTSTHQIVATSLDGTKTQVEFKQVVIATGSSPAQIPGITIDQKTIVDSTGALSLTKKPKTLLCIGGGYIGLELGTFYSKIGTQVTVVEAASELLSGVDPDLTKVVAQNLNKRGIKVMTQTLVESVQNKGGSATVKFKNGTTQNFDVVLVTIGRVPNSKGFGLEKLGLTPDAKGFIEVGPTRQTRVGHVYAIGDVAGQPMLAHKGSKEGIVAAEAIAGKKSVYDVKAMPAVIFTDPEIATVGLTQAQAKAQGLSFNVGQFPYAANGRALSVDEPLGFVKVISETKTGRLLGVHIVGAEASNLIAEAALAIEMGATAEDLALTVHAHPTLPETLMEASEAALGHAIHIYQKPTATPSTQSVTRL